MTEIVLKRQFITDSAGEPVAVILPIEEFALVRELIEQSFPTVDENRATDQTRQPLPPVQESEYFGMWADRQDMRGLSSREWLERQRKQHWAQQ